MAGNNLEQQLRAFREFVLSRGWTIVKKREIAYGHQLTVTDGSVKVPVAIYATGKTLVQGKTGELQDEIKAWFRQDTGQVHASVPKSTLAIRQSITSSTIAGNALGLARVGSDESGKGDYFGPLVVAAVYVDNQTEPRLIELGVRDSKQLTDARIAIMAQKIRKVCQGTVLTYTPAKYNEQYEDIPNVNLLLARAHAQVIHKIATLLPCELAIVDQFGAENLVYDSLQKSGCSIKLEQRPRAESDTAVAAASIVARAEFVRIIHELSETMGIELLKGASNPRIVDVGRKIVAQYGLNGLRKVAKLHFKTTKAILAV